MKKLFARLLGGRRSVASITAGLDKIRADLHAHHAELRETANDHFIKAEAARQAGIDAHDEADRAFDVAGNLGKLLGA